MESSSANISNVRANVQASLAGRYAAALFALAEEQKAIAAVEASLGTLADALAQSPELQALTRNPLVSRTDATRAVAALAATLGLDPLTSKTMGVLAANRRLGQLGALVAAFRTLAAAHRGEASAEVVSAHPLSREQVSALTAKLKAKMGRDVSIALKTDPEILGGLIVKIGSQMIDSSIRTRLNTLAQAMKG